MRLVITVKEIKGNCAAGYRIGDRIVLDEGYKMNLQETGRVSMHALTSVLPYYNAIFKGLSGFGLTKKRGDKNEIYVQCLDPQEYTGGGTVIFKIKRDYPPGA